MLCQGAGRGADSGIDFTVSCAASLDHISGGKLVLQAVLQCDLRHGHMLTTLIVTLNACQCWGGVNRLAFTNGLLEKLKLCRCQWCVWYFLPLPKSSALTRRKIFFTIFKVWIIILFMNLAGYILCYWFMTFLPLLCTLQVFLTECAGPLIIYLMFYFRLPFIYPPKYDFTSSKHWVVQWVSACSCFQGCWCFTQSQALHKCSLSTTNSREAYCDVDRGSKPSVMNCRGATY